MKMICVLLLLLVSAFNGIADTIPDDMRLFFEEYRREKSRTLAETKEKYTREIIEKYLHGRFTILEDGEDKTIYVYPDDYTIESVVVDRNVKVEYRDRMLTLLKVEEEDIYRLVIRETVVGTINKEGEFEPYIGTERQGYYIRINRTKEGPKISYDNSFSQFRILERDVPLFME
ncbi:MAG: hypothetical protein LBK83_11735 [Treponema sp.]|jgi:hypothetical protein|nr:hypothetical protein [Treponema sp.]